MITGCLQKKNGYYYAVLYLKVDGKRKTKWIATKLPVSTTSGEDEMLNLFDAIAGDPLELSVKIAAYYGLRRSEVLGLRWDAIDFERKTISISHKVIEMNVDGKFVPVGEDVLKTKSSFRTLPLIPVVENLLLAEKER